MTAVALLVVALFIMLSTRSHRVVTYGKRGHRIISKSDDHENASTNIRKTDKAADPWRTPVALKTQMLQHFPSESPSPQTVRKPNRTYVKKRGTIPHSPASLKKKRARVRQLIQDDAASKSRSKTDATPSRRPLSSYHPNVPRTPVVGIKKKAKVAGAKGTPIGTKMGKPFSPFMDVDIIVLDDEGQQVSQERRVSRTDVVINSPDVPAPKKTKKKRISAKKSGVEVIAISDSEEEAAPKPPKRGAGRAKAIVISSDESEDDKPLRPVSKPPAAKTSTVSQKRPRMQVEVVISPIKRIVKAKSNTPPVQVQLRTPSPAPAPRYIPLPIPQPSRARQLTPIRRGGSKALFQPPSPPSPTTPTGLDLSLDFDFSELSLTPSKARQSISTPEYLVPLLEECAQSSPHEFSAFIETFPFDPIVQPVDEDISSPNDVQFRKIGEASYSEVFGIGNVVLKVIPLREDTSASAPTISETETPFPSEAKDVLKEIIVTRAMGEVCDGFVKLLRTYIVRGRYPEVLLSLWDEYHQRKGSESIRPGKSMLSLETWMKRLTAGVLRRWVQCLSDVCNYRLAQWRS